MRALPPPFTIALDGPVIVIGALARPISRGANILQIDAGRQVDHLARLGKIDCLLDGLEGGAARIGAVIESRFHWG